MHKQPTNDWRGRYKELTKHSQFVDHAKIEVFIAKEIRQAVAEALDKVLPRGELLSVEPGEDDGANKALSYVSSRIADIKKEYEL